MKKGYILMKARHTERGYTLIRIIRKNLVGVNGFTLIEILVVIAIMGILFSVGYLNFRDFQRRKVVSGVTTQIQGDLRLAQSSAIAGQKPTDPLGTCNSAKTLDSYSFKVFPPSEYKVEANCVVGASTHTMTVKDVNLPSGITISTPPLNPLKFKILGQGTNIVSSSTWNLIISQSGTTNSSTITVTSGGKIQ